MERKWRNGYMKYVKRIGEIEETYEGTLDEIVDMMKLLIEAKSEKQAVSYHINEDNKKELFERMESLFNVKPSVNEFHDKLKEILNVADELSNDAISYLFLSNVKAYFEID
ncbi:hypothetical protein ACTXGU_00135 [Niallia sp. 01092]|uniref:hypothetical protein n=1 Tax=Niallia sp. 01092 TaxID=3457759 RepID=UPI003FD4057E